MKLEDMHKPGTRRNEFNKSMSTYRLHVGTGIMDVVVVAVVKGGGGGI
jgi:hypothetical protein